MGRLIGMALIVVAVWVGAEVYTKGFDAAFGGVFVSGTEAPADRPASDRSADAFQRAYNKSEERVEKLMQRDASADTW